jgi:hypothetical protein
VALPQAAAGGMARGGAALGPFIEQRTRRRLMNRKCWVAAAVVVVALLGCATPHGRVKLASPECNAAERKCKLEIVVIDCTRPEYGIGYTVTNPDIEVTEPSTIEWTITTSGFRFRTDLKGIDITGNGGVFDRPQPIGLRKYSWRDKHRDAGPDFRTKEPYYYYINIERDDGSRCAQFDPWITNY